jgi:PAS domain S-box-containing protein
LIVGFKTGDSPMLIFFLIPIMLSAYAGGLGPGLVATAATALGTAFYLVPPLRSFSITLGVSSMQWMALIVLGILMSVLMESLRESRETGKSAPVERANFAAERKVQAGFALALACLGGIGVMTYFSVARLDEDSRRGQHAHEVIAALRKVLATVTDAETAQRDYLITGEDAYLEPYDKAVETIDANLRELRRLAAAKNGPIPQVEALTSLVAERMASLKQSIEQRRAAGFVTAQETVVGGRGKELHDRILRRVAEMEEVEQKSLQERQARARRSSVTTQTVIIGGSTLAFAVVAVALFVIGRDFAGSREAQAALRVAHNELEMRVSERTAELEQQRAELQLILDTVPALIFFKDLEHRLVRVNLEFARAVNMTREEIVGRTDFELGLPDAERYAHDDEEIIATGEPKRQLIEPMTTHHGQRWMQADKIPHRDASGRIIGVIGFAMDITETRRAGEAQARLAAIVESSEDAIIGKGLDGIITSWNPGAEKVFGFSADEAIGKPMQMLIPPERAHEEPTILARLTRGESVQQFETVRVRKDGKQIDVSATVSPLNDGNGDVIGAATIARDITERKRAEERAHWLASFPERNPNPIVELDLGADMLHYVNPCAAERFPDLRDQGVHHPLLAGLAALEKILIEGKSEAVHRDLIVGEYSYSQTVTYVREAKRLRVYSTDITDLRRVETTLREKEAELHATDRRLAEIVHGMNEACFALDSEWRFTFVNNRCEVLLRRCRDEMIGRSIWQVFDKLSDAPYEKHYRRAMRDRVPVSFEAFSVVAECWAEVRVFPSGNGVAAFFTDITERKAAEENLRALNADLERRVQERTAELNRRRAELESLFESLPGLYLVLTTDLTIVAASDAFLEATMTTRQSILGHGLFEVFPDNPEEPDATGESNLRASLARVLLKAAPDTMAIQRYDIRRPDGVFEERYWSPINSPVVGADREVKYIVHRVEDVTDFVRQKSHPVGDPGELRARMQRMEAEIFLSSQRVQEANQQLEAANKELEAFSYSISHDLRAPLRTMDGFSQAMLEDYGAQLPEEGQRYLHKIRRGAQRMGNLIDDLLTFSRLSRAPLERQIIDTGKLVHNVVEDLNIAREERAIDLRIGEMPTSAGDPALLKQVWINLVSNALKYTRKRDPAIVKIGCTREQKEDVFFVRDNGTGFDMRFAGKLFGVFQRLHRTEDYEGTGVGLAIVQRVIHRHGGRVWAEAAVDRGATFYFTLEGGTRL